MRVVLDTDVVLSAFVSPRGASRLWLRAALQRDIQMVLSVPLAIEYESVLRRPQHLARARASTRDVEMLLDAMVRQADLVAISYLWRPILRDPGDDMVLEAAVNGRATLILSFNGSDFVGAQRFGIGVSAPGPAWHDWQQGRP